MKPLLIIFLFTFSLFSQSIYLLPDEYDDIIYHLSKEIDKAEKVVFILTNEFNNYELKKTLLKAAKRGIKITIISSPNKGKKQLALYKNIQTYLLKPIQSSILDGRVAITLIIIDDKLTCTLATPLETTQMKHNIDIFTCKEYTDDIQSSITKLIKRSQPYLEN
jgi:sugar-specific transcriptional regulator TrmB